MRGGKAGTLSRIAAAVIVSAMLAGCRENQTETPAIPVADRKEQKLSVKYVPPIELTTVGTTLAAPVYAQGDDMNNNEWTRYLRDSMGIIVKKRWEVPNDQLEQKTNLMIASGDIPDFFIATPTQLVQLQRADMIEPLSDIYARYATPAVKAVVEQAGPEVLEAAKINGKLMGLPFTGVAKESVSVLWVREDWRRKLDLREPRTMDDLLAIAEAFALRDPDGNGINDTFGFGLDKMLNLAVGLFNGYHAYKGIWIRDNDGKLAYGSIQPEMKNALAKLQEMYRSGQIDPDFGIREGAKVYQTIGDGKLGMIFANISASSLYLQTPDSRWFAYAAPSSDTRPAMVQHGLNLNTGFWVVKKGVRNPEAVMRMADEFVSKFYANTDDDVYRKFNFDIASKRSIWQQAPVKLFKSYKNAEISIHLEPYLRSGQDPTDAEKAKLTPEEREKYGQIIDYMSGKSADWSVIARNGIDGGGTVILDYVKNGRMIPDRFYGSPTKTMVQKQAGLVRLEEEVLTKIIMGAPLDEFDKFVEEWKRLGGDEMTKEVNEWAKSK
ncbi:extracellular solute-binding protein [Paenibacillus mesophilus]|uniref:extracellular solute-binding protein n=1 Tax=Paenibacillus mesophilus TaxID=2582849 RepID=UPI001305409F|nr:extracellular solute-binding protein [Paenibacillus mesophilus]